MGEGRWYTLQSYSRLRCVQKINWPFLHPSFHNHPNRKANKELRRTHRLLQFLQFYKGYRARRDLKALTLALTFWRA